MRQWFFTKRPGRRPRAGVALLGTEDFAGAVVANADDGFQNISTGVMTIADNEVRIGSDFSAEPNIAGFRFAGVTLAQGETITYAHVRFTAAVTNTPAPTFRIYGEKAANALTFTTTAFDLTGRTKTTAYVDWTPAAWAEGQHDADTTTPDLTSIVQELVDQAAWTPDNAMVFLIEYAPSNVGSNVRGAWSHYAFPSRAAELAVNTLAAPDPVEDPVEGAYYISTSGSDANAGTITEPWRSITKAAATLVAGDTVYLRGGVYDVVSTDVYLSDRLFADGTALNPITVASYPGERAIFDGFNHPNHPRAFDDGKDVNFPHLLSFKGDFLRWQNIDFRGGTGRGLGVTANDCTFTGCRFYKNHGDGFFSYRGDSVSTGVWTMGNRHIVEDCDAFDNNSVSNGGDSASGIKLPSNRDGIIRRCRFWNNSDDGLDFFGARLMTVEDCLAFNNGYGSTGNGMGFKMSGGNYTEGTIIRNCITSRNKNDGFDNNEGWDILFDRCTSWNDGRYGFVVRHNARPTGEDPNVVQSCIAFAFGTAAILNGTGDGEGTETLNTWNQSITDPDFLSVDPENANFLALDAASDARGAGVAGVDLGAIPFGETFPLDTTGIWMSSRGGEDRVYE